MVEVITLGTRGTGTVVVVITSGARGTVTVVEVITTGARDTGIVVEAITTWVEVGHWHCGGGDYLRGTGRRHSV